MFFPGTITSNGSVQVKTEKMLVRDLDTSCILKGLRLRGTLHSADPQIDLEEDSDGFLVLHDAITGDHIVSVMR